MRKIKYDSKPIKYLMIMLFIIYILLLVWIVVFKLQFSVSELDYHRSINWIPFYYSNEVGFLFHLTEVIYNCLFFLPFGIYLKAIMNTGYSKQIVLFGVVFSIALEAVQYIFAIGATDVTDVITNTCGVTVGILVYDFLLKALKKRNTVNMMIVILSVVCLFIVGGIAYILITGN